jgi:pyruvate,water dikinase
MTQQQVSFKTETPFVFPLTAITGEDVQRVGSKAANLGEMLRAGFPVPDGVVLTTSAFDYFLKANGLDTTSGSEAVVKATIPSEIRDQLSQVSDRFRNTPLAVRSSGIAEDLPDASFAGQYTTVLNVQGFDALTAAVKECWASTFSDHATKYRMAKGEITKVEMAILIQVLIPADAAGVAFSANPVTGDRRECVINAVRGRGERLVSGQATPEEWVFRGEEVIRHIASEDAITIDEAHAIAELARRAEMYFTTPQDVEWALKEGKLYLLQTRPITAIPNSSTQLTPIHIEVPSGFWERDTAHFSSPITPMLRSAIIPIQESSFHHMMEENSMLIDGFQFREIGGWLYSRVVPLGEKAPSPNVAYKRVEGLIHVVRSDKIFRDIERWYNLWKPNIIKRISQLNQVDVTLLSNNHLLQHLKAVYQFVDDCINIHALITAADFLVTELVLTCQDLLGWNARKSLTLLSGLSSQTTEPVYHLFELTQYVQKKPEIRQLLNHVDKDTPDKLTTTDATFASAFNLYLQNFGKRTLRWDLDQETLIERPELVLKMIQDQLTHNYDFTAEAAALEQQRTQILAEARQSLATHSSEDQTKFERALERATRAYPIREEHEYYLTSVPFALFRYALLEIGQRLMMQGKLDQSNDIFFLELDEAAIAFQKGLDRKILVTQRKGEYAWAQANPGPLFFGEPPPPPSIEGLPPEAQHAMRVMAWLVEGMFASQTIQQTKQEVQKGRITGLAASSGRYTGSVRLIKSEAEFTKFRVGEVLVCTTTQPPWSVLFPSVGALVTDGGGILSHPAIIAREYHVPAVVATGNATSILRDGQVVTVDGDTGSIEIVTDIN